VQVLADLCCQAEGQRALLRCTAPSDDMLGALLGLAQQQHSGAVGEAAMLVLRQVALCPDSQAHFVSKHGALQQLVDALAAAAQHPERAAAAAHALWALVHGGGRAKAALRRCERWADGIQAGLQACRQDEHASWAPCLAQPCQALQRLLA
jgi:hypothetical protein